MVYPCRSPNLKRMFTWYFFNPFSYRRTDYAPCPWVKDAPYWFWGQKVKGQHHGAWLFVNGFRTIVKSVINLWSWNFLHLLPMNQGWALLILWSKGQGHGTWLIVNGFQTITDSVINLWSWNFIHMLPMSQGCAHFILRSKVMVMGQWWLKMVSRP